MLGGQVIAVVHLHPGQIAAQALQGLSMYAASVKTSALP
jgi:hypothetical protein